MEGATWRVQGVADSSLAVQQLLQALAPLGPWQQTPAVVELMATPSAAQPAGPGLHYVVQARWREVGLVAVSGSASTPASLHAAPLMPPPTQALVNR